MNNSVLTPLQANKVWFYFVNYVLTPSKHVSTMRQDHAILLYTLVKGCSLNVGKIMEQPIIDYAENSFSGNIPHSTFITLLCFKGGVTFNKTEEKCPRSSHLIFIGVLKTLAQGEEVNKERKRKRTTTELPREAILEVGEEPKSKEIGGFKDYPKQPVLSARVEETMPT